MIIIGVVAILLCGMSMVAGIALGDKSEPAFKPSGKCGRPW